MDRPHGLILAGGAGRRLGGVDKALLLLHGRPMLAHVLDRLSGQTAACALSAAGDAARFADFALPVLDDGAHRGKGPLAGLLSGLRWAGEQGADTMLTVPVDTPFIPTDLAARLGHAPSVAAHCGRVHHLVALWPVSAVSVLEAFLEGPGPYRVSGLAGQIGSRTVDFDETGDPFLNINTEADRAAAETFPC